MAERVSEEEMGIVATVEDMQAIEIASSMMNCYYNSEKKNLFSKAHCLHQTAGTMGVSLVREHRGY